MCSLKILKSAVDRPCLSWWHKRRAKRDIGGYPPRIIMTVTYTRSLIHATNCKLEIQGIREIDAFNMTIPPGGKFGGGK